MKTWEFAIICKEGRGNFDGFGHVHWGPLKSRYDIEYGWMCLRRPRGIFSDDTGIWLYGYFGKLKECTSLEAELWGIYRGLTIILEKGYVDWMIETDSTEAVELMQTKLQ